MSQQVPLKSDHITQATDRTFVFSLVFTIMVVAALFIAVIALISTFK